MTTIYPRQQHAGKITTDADEWVTMIVTVGEPCPHENGWWIVVRWWLWSRRYYVCSDCGDHFTDTEFAALDNPAKPS